MKKKCNLDLIRQKKKKNITVIIVNYLNYSLLISNVIKNHAGLKQSGVNKGCSVLYISFQNTYAS